MIYIYVYHVCIAASINTYVCSNCPKLHPASGSDWTPELPLLGPLMLDRATTDLLICDGCSGVEVVRAFVLKLSNKVKNWNME